MTSVISNDSPRRSSFLIYVKTNINIYLRNSPLAFVQLLFFFMLQIRSSKGMFVWVVAGGCVGKAAV
jgi:hypothetical protein